MICGSMEQLNELVFLKTEHCELGSWPSSMTHRLRVTPGFCAH